MGYVAQSQVHIYCLFGIWSRPRNSLFDSSGWRMEVLYIDDDNNSYHDLAMVSVYCNVYY